MSCPVDKEVGLTLLAFFNGLRLEMQSRAMSHHRDLNSREGDDGTWWVLAGGGGYEICMWVNPNLTCELQARKCESNTMLRTYSNIDDPKLLTKIVQAVNHESGWDITVAQVEARMSTQEAKNTLRNAAFPYWFVTDAKSYGAASRI